MGTWRWSADSRSCCRIAAVAVKPTVAVVGFKMVGDTRWFGDPSAPVVMIEAA